MSLWRINVRNVRRIMTLCHHGQAMVTHDSANINDGHACCVTFLGRQTYPPNISPQIMTIFCPIVGTDLAADFDELSQSMEIFRCRYLKTTDSSDVISVDWKKTPDDIVTCEQTWHARPARPADDLLQILTFSMRKPNRRNSRVWNGRGQRGDHGHPRRCIFSVSVLQLYSTSYAVRQYDRPT